MLSYLREKTIGIATTVGDTVVGGGQAVVQTVLTEPVSNVLNTSGLNSSKPDVSASFNREMTPSERVQRILSKRRKLNEQDRLFLLSYAGNTPKTTGQTVSKESID